MSLLSDLVKWAEETPNGPLLSNGAQERYTVSQALSKIISLQSALQRLSCNKVALWMPDSPSSLLGILAVSGLGKELFLFHPDFSANTVHELMRLYGIDICIVNAERAGIHPSFYAFEEMQHVQSGVSSLMDNDLNSYVYIFTSGTTGNPKLVPHIWRRLALRVRRKPQLFGARWLLMYGVTRYAGIQVVLQAVLTRSAVVILPHRSVDEIVRVIHDEQITHASGTPSLWRRVALTLPPSETAALSLRQLTLGGEPTYQPTLDLLRSRFPNARITHTYATTEVGVCFSTSDGKEGFPLEQLERNPYGVECRVVDGELLIRSPFSRIDVSSDDWIRTGDQVSIGVDRFYIIGRRDGCINVGGSKVYPEEIERLILNVPGVREVRVGAQRSSLLGQLVKAEVVVDPGVDKATLREQIVSYCRTLLEPYKVPRLITFVDELTLTTSGKVSRRYDEQT